LEVTNQLTDLWSGINDAAIETLMATFGSGGCTPQIPIVLLNNVSEA